MIKKIIGVSLLVSAALSGVAVAETTSTPKTAGPKGIDIVCVQSAVGKRDTAITASLDVFYNAMKTAFQTRQSALNSAWSITDRNQRRSALKTAWKNFTNAQKTASKTYKNAKGSAWDQFYKDRKACGPGAASEDPTTHAVDNN